MAEDEATKKRKSEDEEASEEGSGGKRKLILLIVGAVLLLGLGIGGGVFVGTMMAEDSNSAEKVVADRSKLAHARHQYRSLSTDVFYSVSMPNSVVQSAMHEACDY